MNEQTIAAERFIEHLAAASKSSAQACGLSYTKLGDDRARLLWQDIAKRYSEPVRAYHTLQHIAQMYYQFTQVQDRLEQPHTLALALYYHDIIYDPTRADNELKSAEYAIELLHPYLSTSDCQRVSDLILMTASHKLSVNDDSPEKERFDTDAAYFLDIDLSILGAPWTAYEQYAQAVRYEYQHVADSDYRAGRIRVLQDLLKHPSLYLTREYFARLESTARDNIKRELDSLLS